MLAVALFSLTGVVVAVTTIVSKTKGLSIVEPTSAAFTLATKPILQIVEKIEAAKIFLLFIIV